MANLFDQSPEQPVQGNPLYLIGLKVENLRKLQAFQMKFSPQGLTVLKGKNQSGKSTVIDALTILLRGFDKKYMPDDIITHGKDKAEIIGYLGDYCIKRVITEKTTRLQVTKNVDGAELELKSAQTFLDTLTNELTFNPFPFLDKKPEEKVKFIMNLAKIDFTSIDAKIKEKEILRTAKGQEIKKLGNPEPVEPANEVSVSDLYNQLQVIKDANAGLKQKWANEVAEELKVINAFNDQQKFYSERKEDFLKKTANLIYDKNILEKNRSPLEDNSRFAKLLDIEISIIDKTIAFFQKETEKNYPAPQPLIEVVSNIPEPQYQSTAELEEKIRNADDINNQARAYASYQSVIALIEKKNSEYDAFTQEIEKLREDKRNMLANANIIEGLELKDEGLFYNGIFSENWSRSEGAVISSKIWQKSNPKLRAIFIDSGEQYDSKTTEELGKWAVENHIQAIITKVADEHVPEENVLWIEEGQII